MTFLGSVTKNSVGLAENLPVTRRNLIYFRIRAGSKSPLRKILSLYRFKSPFTSKVPSAFLLTPGRSSKSAAHFLRTSSDLLSSSFLDAGLNGRFDTKHPLGSLFNAFQLTPNAPGSLNPQRAAQTCPRPSGLAGSNFLSKREASMPPLVADQLPSATEPDGLKTTITSLTRTRRTCQVRGKPRSCRPSPYLLPQVPPSSPKLPHFNPFLFHHATIRTMRNDELKTIIVKHLPTDLDSATVDKEATEAADALRSLFELLLEAEIDRRKAQQSGPDPDITEGACP